MSEVYSFGSEAQIRVNDGQPFLVVHAELRTWRPFDVTAVRRALAPHDPTVPAGLFVALDGYGDPCIWREGTPWLSKSDVGPEVWSALLAGLGIEEPT